MPLVFAIAHTETGERRVPIREAADMFRTRQAKKVTNENCETIKIDDVSQYLADKTRMDFIGLGALIGFNEARVRATSPEIAATLFEQGFLKFAFRYSE